MHQRNVIVIPEQGDDLFGFTLTHQSMIDINAGQALANCLMNQDGNHRTVHPARQATDDPAGFADLTAHAFNRLFLKGGHGPVAGTAANGMYEI